MMKAYLGGPETTTSMMDSEGWAHTGDIGYADKDGYLYVVDRAKDFTKFRGLQYEENELLLGMVEEIRNRRQASDWVNFQAHLLDSVREAIVATDLRQRVTFWNKGAEALFGYKTAEIIGKSLDETIIPARREIQEERRQELTDLRKRGKWNGQVLRRRRDGTELWTDSFASTITDSNGESSGFVAIQYNVTEQKEVEERLRFQVQLLDSVRESVVAIDLEEAGWSFGDLVQKCFSAIAPRKCWAVPWVASSSRRRRCPRLLGSYARSNAHNKNVEHPSCSAPKGYSEFLADIAVAPVHDVEGETVGLIAIHRDITEIRRHEETIRDPASKCEVLQGS